MRTKRDTAKEPTIWRMQEMELKRSGRKKEYDKLMQEAISRTGMTVAKLKPMVLDKMGLGDHGEVIRNYRENLQKIATMEKEEDALRDLEKERIVNRQSEFQKVFSSLPSNAQRQVEFRWIENHPAMVIRKPVDGRPIEISVDDIVDAPSKSAVGQLKHWVNRKDEFYKSLMTAAGKKTTAKEGEDALKAEKDRQDDSIDEIKAMLGHIRGGP